MVDSYIFACGEKENKNLIDCSKAWPKIPRRAGRVSDEFS